MSNALPISHVHVFGDESSHKANHNFMVYGTVSCDVRRLDAIKRVLEFPNFYHEFHWKKSGSHLQQHKQFAGAIFDCIKQYRLRFRCIAVNARHMRHREFNQSDPDLGLEKYIFFQLLSYARDYKFGNARFYVTLDAGREDRFPPTHKKRMLNARYRKETGFDHDAFEIVDVTHSHESRLVQAADVLSGAVAWVWNKRYETGGEKKESLATYVAQRARLPIIHPLAKKAGVQSGHYLSLNYPTYAGTEKGFAIWDFDLRKTIQKEQQALSAAQLAAIIDPTTKFGDLPNLGYEIRLSCAYCNDVVPNKPADPQFEAHRVTAVYRPKCSKCGRPRAALLHPDPRDTPLLSIADRTRASP
jgi:Protein of unknown function (DUF3800)